MAFNIDKDKCVGCGSCVQECPANAIILENGKAVIDEAVCVQCGTCQACCPMNAIDQD